MLIIPIGHDQDISRVPYLTIGLMALCLLVQLYASFAGPSEEDLMVMRFETQQLIRELWDEHGESYASKQLGESAREPRSAADLRDMIKTRGQMSRRFGHDVLAGKVVDERDPRLRRLLELRAQQRRGSGILAYGYQPGSSPVHTLVTYAFLHGGWLHLIGNMLFLWLCGCNMEDRWGNLWWLLLYLGGGVVAALSFALARGWHTDQPLVGASGAIAAAMGAFLVVHHSASIRLFWWYWWRSGTFDLRAYWALPLWFVQQLMGLAVEGPLVPVAYSAHIGGFAFGVVFALVMKLSGVDRRILAATEQKETVFEEHPLFLQALARLSAGDPEGAQAQLETLLAQQPDHLAATVELAQLRLEGDEPAGLGQLVGQAILMSKRSGNRSTPQQLYRDLQRRFPEQQIGPRALFAVAEALEASDPRAALEAFSALRTRYPDDMMVPKAMLKSVALHAQALNEPDEARALARQISQQYADTPYAEQTEKLLERRPV